MLKMSSRKFRLVNDGPDKLMLTQLTCSKNIGCWARSAQAWLTSTPLSKCAFVDPHHLEPSFRSKWDSECLMTLLFRISVKNSSLWFATRVNYFQTR
jgi:hypothetical protein